MLRIKKLDFNEVHIDDKVFRDTDIYLHNDAVEEAERTHTFAMEHFDKIMLRDPECVIVGNGFKSRVGISEDVVKAAKRNGVELHLLPTPEAVRKFQELARSRRVSVFLHMSD